WERKRDGGFPGPKELKQRVRDVIAPERDMGHIDRKSTPDGDPAP
ncbi:MAG: Rdx family protein, partial [Komagataeibacter saccharivorans]